MPRRPDGSRLSPSPSVRRIPAGQEPYLRAGQNRPAFSARCSASVVSGPHWPSWAAPTCCCSALMVTGPISPSGVTLRYVCSAFLVTGPKTPSVVTRSFHCSASIVCGPKLPSTASGQNGLPSGGGGGGLPLACSRRKVSVSPLCDAASTDSATLIGSASWPWDTQSASYPPAALCTSTTTCVLGLRPKTTKSPGWLSSREMCSECASIESVFP